MQNSGEGSMIDKTAESHPGSVMVYSLQLVSIFAHDNIKWIIDFLYLQRTKDLSVVQIRSLKIL